MVSYKSERIGGKKVIEECKIVPKSLSLVKEKKNTRGKKRKKVRKYKSKAEQNFSARAREDRARARVARRKREFVYLFKVCVKSKDFSPRSIKKVPKISSAGFFLLYKILRYIKITCS